MTTKEYDTHTHTMDMDSIINCTRLRRQRGTQRYARQHGFNKMNVSGDKCPGDVNYCEAESQSDRLRLQPNPLLPRVLDLDPCL